MPKLKENQKKISQPSKSNKKLKNQNNNNKQISSKMRSSLPAITSTTQKLQIKIADFKNQHASITKSLQSAIQNNKLYRSISAAQLQNSKHTEFLDKKHVIKQKSVLSLQKNLKKRIYLNQEAQNQLSKMQQAVISKKQAVQKRLAYIQSHNLQKIKQIQEFQKNFLQKVRLQLNKNLEKQKHLKKEFDKISQQNIKIVKTKDFQNKLDQQAWKSLMDEKINLEILMQNQKNKQNKLIKQKNPQIFKKEAKVAATEKQQQKKIVKQRVKLDIKEAGRQYLDFAKKKGSVAAKQTKKIKPNYMNINLKVINYEHTILERIGNNDGMLSKSEQQTKLGQQKMSDFDIEVNINERILALNHGQTDIIPILQQKQEDSQDKSELSDIGNTINIVTRIRKDIEQIQQHYENDRRRN